MFRLCEEERAELFMKATKFNMQFIQEPVFIIAKKNCLRLTYIAIHNA